MREHLRNFHHLAHIPSSKKKFRQKEKGKSQLVIHIIMTLITETTTKKNKRSQVRNLWKKIEMS